MKNLRTSRLAELVIEAYPDPDPYVSFEEFSRARHEDLPGLTLEEIDQERFVARLRWALDSDPSPWLRDRLMRLDREAERRRQRVCP